MIKKCGFTLVEILVVITVIGILVTITMLTMSMYQKDARDTQRNSNVSTLADALEKYFDKKGEYPSCAAMTASVDVITANTLKGVDRSAFIVPNAPSGVTNSIRCGQTLTMSGQDFFEYSGGGGTNCTGSVACTTFTLKYRSEGENSIKSISSRRTAK